MTNSEAIAVLMEQKRYVHENSVPDQALDMGIKALKDERKKGKWLSHYEYCSKKGMMPSGLVAFWWCDQCEEGVEHPTSFCPKCGADMRE